MMEKKKMKLLIKYMTWLSMMMEKKKKKKKLIKYMTDEDLFLIIW
jgi:hypothetical protein